MRTVQRQNRALLSLIEAGIDILKKIREEFLRREGSVWECLCGNWQGENPLRTCRIYKKGRRYRLVFRVANRINKMVKLEDFELLSDKEGNLYFGSILREPVAYDRERDLLTIGVFGTFNRITD